MWVTLHLWSLLFGKSHQNVNFKSKYATKARGKARRTQVGTYIVGLTSQVHILWTIMTVVTKLKDALDYQCSQYTTYFMC